MQEGQAFKARNISFCPAERREIGEARAAHSKNTFAVCFLLSQASSLLRGKGGGTSGWEKMLAEDDFQTLNALQDEGRAASDGVAQIQNP